ncbi:alkylation response protein AidB-like acyl-CoA dehydrogenase [Mycobacterium frederiksbergense]|uniref:Alkylation response protein AidB-like acyl-CoA dehydrogenase n=1 Tax=Mycolicibacterium frederiksbergense TaxID=117567 RepID=A0ABT6L5E7_9MYCO|nr:acyl-CoA dehydrogenase family protein [Mycolicibacterium frederiksbergense]MDH6198188.1 alkylation response protein AidB-like acyl-CoA dehydrogenase [Mycolicibacterium frederiksbergense]
MTTETTTLDADIRDFVESVRKICESAPTADQWSPTAPGDDRNPLLRSRLADAGWFDIAAEPHATEFLGAAGIELGRALAPVDLVDDLLGHGVALGASVIGDIDLARYRGAGDTVWLCGTEGAELVEVVAAEPVRYVDAQAISIITTGSVAQQVLTTAAYDAWIAAMTGYVAGLTAGALELAGGHAQQRIAFGRPLTELDSVAKKIADCATASEGLQMAAQRGPDAFVLRQAPVTAFRVMRVCHQILGGLGFTLEYPLQRYSRRVEALRVWTPAVITALGGARAAG